MISTLQVVDGRSIITTSQWPTNYRWGGQVATSASIFMCRVVGKLSLVANDFALSFVANYGTGHGELFRAATLPGINLCSLHWAKQSSKQWNTNNNFT